MVNLKFSKKNRQKPETQNFKNPHHSFVRTIGKFRTSFKLLTAICRRSSVLKLSPPLGPVLTKTNKIRYNFNFRNFKNPKHSFVRTIRKKIRKSLKSVGCDL